MDGRAGRDEQVQRAVSAQMEAVRRGAAGVWTVARGPWWRGRSGEWMLCPVHDAQEIERGGGPLARAEEVEDGGAAARGWLGCRQRW